MLCRASCNLGWSWTGRGSCKAVGTGWQCPRAAPRLCEYEKRTVRGTRIHYGGGRYMGQRVRQNACTRCEYIMGNGRHAGQRSDGMRAAALVG
eukprot:7152802-Prymnesium_polylepis.1